MLLGTRCYCIASKKRQHADFFAGMLSSLILRNNAADTYFLAKPKRMRTGICILRLLDFLEWQDLFHGKRKTAMAPWFRLGRHGAIRGKKQCFDLLSPLTNYKTPSGFRPPRSTFAPHYKAYNNP